MGNNGEKAAFCDNAVFVYYPMSPYIAKCDVVLRVGRRIVLRFPMRDPEAAEAWLSARFDVPHKTIVRC